MSVEIKAPTFPESVQEGNIATWHKQPGEAVSRDDLIVDIETDKVVLEVVAPCDGVMGAQFKEEGGIVLSGELIATIEAGVAVAKSAIKDAETDNMDDKLLSPAARKIAAERGIDPHSIVGTGKDGRVTKEDVVNASLPVVAAPAPITSTPVQVPSELTGDRVERRVPMTRMRSRIADRLLEVSQSTAMLTTFNEVDMHRVMNLRTQFKDQFAKMHDGTRLGFMGIFVRAAVEALKRFPTVNASIDGKDIVYHAYQDVGVAVSTEKGLVVPVLRNADTMSIASVENKVAEFGAKAKSGKLSIEDMTGGTFTITNGGVFGSLLSTPILNPPQSAILGMHTIKDRPVVEDGQVVVRPMMYLALSYDHRLIDGKEAVSFLIAIKDMIENPAKILLEI